MISNEEARGKKRKTQDPGTKNRNPGHPPLPGIFSHLVPESVQPTIDLNHHSQYHSTPMFTSLFRA